MCEAFRSARNFLYLFHRPASVATQTTYNGRRPASPNVAASKRVVRVYGDFIITTVRGDSEMRMPFGEAPTFDIFTSTGLSHRRAPLLLKRVHQLIECLGELLDAFVFELLGHRVQINAYFA
jgi:hypothetical protein